MNPRVTAALVLSLAFLGGAILLAGREASGGGDSDTPADGVEAPELVFEGASIPDGVRAPDFDLSDERGRRFTMRSLRGRVAMVTFLYTNCEESCPPQAQQMRAALSELGHDVPLVAVAVDPPRDTPESARRFNSEQRLTGRLRWVLGTREELRPVWKGYAIQAQAARVEHQARIVLVDRDGFQRVGYPLSEVTPDRLAHDVRVLEGE